MTAFSSAPQKNHLAVFRDLGKVENHRSTIYEQLSQITPLNFLNETILYYTIDISVYKKFLNFYFDHNESKRSSSFFKPFKSILASGQNCKLNIIRSFKNELVPFHSIFAIFDVIYDSEQLAQGISWHQNNMKLS